MRTPFWSPSREWLALRDEMLPVMEDVLERGDLILRKDVEDFERDFAKVVGTKYAVALNSGTDALYLSLILAGIKPGDEVITSSYTFRATVDAILHAGAIPVLTEYDEDWKLYKTAKTKAIIPVHIAGEIQPWLPEEDVVMIEDACQAITSAPIKGLTACYSFYPAKILGCYGDGGAIATDNRELAERLKLMRHHFKGDDDYPGYNSRLDNLQAAVLNVKLKHLTQFIGRRKDIALQYDKRISLLVKTPSPRNVYQDYIIYTKHAAALHDFLAQKGVDAMLNEYVFPRNVPKGPRTVAYEQNTLRLPCTPYTTDEEVDHVVESIRAFFDQLKV